LDDSEEKRSQISKKLKGFGGEDPKSPEEPLVTASEGVEEKQELGLRGGGALNPLIYTGIPIPGHVRDLSQTCPVHRSDMSGKNCLDNSVNFRNCLKR
jgi:hypothetical protein